MNPTTRKIVVGIAGGVLVLLGLVMVPLPGPGIPVVIAGIVLLSTEFAWAARVRERGREMWESARTARA